MTYTAPSRSRLGTKIVAVILSILLSSPAWAQDINPVRPSAPILWRPYKPVLVPPVRLANSSRFRDLIRGGKLYLQAHIARPNPQADHLDGGEALAIFPGPHAYISPGWYEAGPAVPTWNYASVHAYGPARRIDDPVWLRDLVRRLSERHEAREPAPWSMEGLAEAYVQSMLKGIVGIEIAVNRLEGKFKLSQNRPAADRPRIIAALERRADPDSHAVAQLMREREPAT